MHGRHGEHFFRGEQFPFQLPVFLLDAHLGGIATGRPGVQIAFMPRKRPSRLAQSGEVTFRRRVANRDAPGLRDVRIQILDILFRRAASMVAHPPELELHRAVF